METYPVYKVKKPIFSILNGNYIIVDRNGESAMIDPKGKFRFPFNKYILGRFNDVAKVVPFKYLDGEYWGVLKEGGEILFPPDKYVAISRFYTDEFGNIRAAVKTKDGEQYYLYLNGHLEKR